MHDIERQVWREARAMTRREVITKAIVGQLSWVQAAEILRISTRHARRLRRKLERWGMSAVMDQRGGRPRRKRIRRPAHRVALPAQARRLCRFLAAARSSKLAGVELELVLSSKHERVVRNDNTVTFKNLILQSALNPPAHPFRALPGDGASILRRQPGHQLSEPPARPLRCRRRTAPPRPQ
jgi:transposase